MLSNRMVTFVLACAAAGSAASQPPDAGTVAQDFSTSLNAMINASEEHAHLFDLAANVMGSMLNGGKVCAADWHEVRRRQASHAPRTSDCAACAR